MILLIFGLAAGIELPGIIKKKQWKELAVFSGFLLCGLTITVMHQIFKFEFFRINYWFISVFSKK
jgi:hypothetical protein